MGKGHQSAITIPCVKGGDDCFPDLALLPAASDIGFWGRRRKDFLREHRPITFHQPLLAGELFKYPGCSIKRLPGRPIFENTHGPAVDADTWRSMLWGRRLALIPPAWPTR